MLNFADTKRKSLERRLTAAVEEWTALTDELTRNRDVVDRLRIERHVDQLEADIKKIESALKELEGQPLEQNAIVSRAEPVTSPDTTESASSVELPSDSPMTDVATGLKVFLCHGKEDKAVVRQLHDRLQADGIAPWLDTENIMPGQNWQREITRAVRESHVVLVCLSSLTVKKESFIQKEIKMALDVVDEKPEGTIYLIPVRLEECEIPERLRPWQWVDYFAANGYGKLMWALKHRAGQIGVPLRPIGPVWQGPDLVSIPAGEFTMGSTEAQIDALLQSNSSYKREWFTNEIPQHRVYLDAYSIYKTPVTVAQYLAFCAATGYQQPVAPSFNPKWKNADHPIVNVSWEDAQAYCAWMSKQTGLQVTLPTEAQWEKASRGTDGRQYPWSNKWDTDLCVNGTNSGGGTASVGSKPDGASPYGVLDMSGNVWEWCSDWYAAGYYQSAPVRNPSGPDKGASRVLRGGSWDDSNPGSFRCADRFRLTPDLWYYNAGFRCALRSDPL